MAVLCLHAIAACGGDRDAAEDVWEGTIDTLPSGAVLVSNPSYGIWDSSSAWRVVEELRLGSLEGSGPELFGSISALEVDALGRIYVFESQAQEIRVFDSTGVFVRTIGREGAGPGEFRQGIGLAWAPAGNLWAVDPGNSRISVFDTAGTYLSMRRIMGGYVRTPWPGGFDEDGRFYHYGIDLESESGERFVMVRFDTLLNPIDTVWAPRPPEDRYFELRSEGGLTLAGIPFTPSITSRIGPAGHLWFSDTRDYRVYERNVAGDTLSIVTRDFEPLPVTDAEIDSAMASFDWFTRQGGRIDRSRFPRVKPALRSIYIDDETRLWVVPYTDAGDSRRVLDVFGASGRYLGRLRLPFRLAGNPIPLFRRGSIYAVTHDELDVPYVVRARIAGITAEIPDTFAR